MFSLLVEQGTVHGTILQLQGKGIPEIGTGAKGDFLVEIHIKIPKPKSQEDISMLEELKNKEIFIL
jgi:DnaJ-class molecular chaperone